MRGAMEGVPMGWLPKGGRCVPRVEVLRMCEHLPIREGARLEEVKERLQVRCLHAVHQAAAAPE